MPTEPMTRKRCTVNVKERRQVSYRIGQKVYDRNVCASGVIEAMTPLGALLYCSYFAAPANRWFAEWNNIRPNSGRYWL